MLEHADAVLNRLGAATITEVFEQYLGNPLFQAARYDELVLDDDPYRRPVRPDDLGMVDFSGSLTKQNANQLSGLMAHRILLNIYDAGKLLLPKETTPEKWERFQRFYDPSTVSLGELLRPYLEAHVFRFVRQEAAERVAATAAGIEARIAEFGKERSTQAADLAAVTGSAGAPSELVGMLAIQSLGATINARLRPALRTGAFGDPAAQALLTSPEHLPADPTYPVAELAERIGLRDQPHSYYQYYLPSSLALMNYLNATYRPGQVFAFAGAVAAQYLEGEALASAGVWDRLDRDDTAPPGQRLRTTGDATTPLQGVLRDVERVGGGYGLREFSRGFEEYAVLLDVHHTDRMRQSRWVASMPAYREEAERLADAIERHHIDVDLDTFVESWEECSTTHVHDDDRLIVIETGEMQFWNCFGVEHRYRPGDKALVPRHSLHGSVVLSGECVYHQPVITEELRRTYGTPGQA